MTALPHAFYPESSWRDDMQLGAAELALAAHRLGAPGRSATCATPPASPGASSAPHSTDTLNLYDTGALADVSLAAAMAQDPRAGPLAVTRHDLVATCAPRSGAESGTPATTSFGAAASVDDFDVNSHTFGLIATVGLYDALTHTHRFQRFASRAADLAPRRRPVGGDARWSAWVTRSRTACSTRSPTCAAPSTARPPLDVGAVVNGPNGKGNFDGGLGGFQTGMRHCTSAARRLTGFDGHGSRYVDDVRAWQTDEPALDMTGVGHHRRRGPAPPAPPRAAAAQA